MLTGKVSAKAFHEQHTDTGFVDFLDHVGAAHAVVGLYVICDYYATHKHQNVKD